MLASTLSGIPYSFSVHGPRVFFMVKARHLDEKLRRALFVRCISHFCRSQCAMWTGPDTWPRLHVVHCGVDVSAYSPRIHAGPGSHVLFVGRPGLRKGLPWLVEALARLCAERADLRITIVGDGPERPSVEALVRSAGISERVTFTGYQSAAQIAEWLTTADVFVLPSLAEGVPIVLMEAMAAAVPVVTTNVGGSSELVIDGVNGFLVPPVVPEALVHRIRQLLDDPGLRARLGRAGRETVIRDFDLRQETARLRELFEAAHALAFTGPSTDGAGNVSPGPGAVENGATTRWAPGPAS
jgi:glycosyltransferase involved in cell wall biosynthesis